MNTIKIYDKDMNVVESFKVHTTRLSNGELSPHTSRDALYQMNKQGYYIRKQFTKSGKLKEGTPRP